MLNLDRPLVVIDTETTGVETDMDRIVQIAVIRIDDPKRIPTQFCCYIDPGVPIPPEATAVHGITDDMVRGQLSFSQVWGQHVAALVEGADVCAYNARFDLAMIDRELRNAGLKWDRSKVRIIDPMVIFRQRVPHTLEGALVYYCDAIHGSAHDALQDAKATLDVLAAQMANYDLETIEDAAKASTPPADDRFCDSGRKFYWRFHRPHHATGKYRGKPIEHDLSYLDWMVGPKGIADMPKDTRDLINRVRGGKLVTREVAKVVEQFDAEPA